MSAHAARPGGDTPGPSAFRCAETLLFRAAIRPPAPDGPGDDEWPGDDEAALRDYLRTAAADDRLREAVSLASPSLSRTLDAVLSGEPVRARQLRRAVRALARYRLRMSGRATPFGTMAGVAAIGFADEPAAAGVR